MESTSFMRVDEVAQELSISKSYAYKIVQKLNAELKEKGFMTISGRVNKQYFIDKLQERNPNKDVKSWFTYHSDEGNGAYYTANVVKKDFDDWISNGMNDV